MLHIQHRPLMPHAVPFGRPPGEYGSQTHRTFRPHPRDDHSSSHTPSNSVLKSYRTASASALTPPTEMHVAFNPSRQGPHSHLDKNISANSSQYAQPSQQYASMGYARDASRSNGAARQFPSPKTTTATRERESRQPETSVAPSSRIPDTVRTPQTGIAQLAAEVCAEEQLVQVPNSRRLGHLPFLVRRCLHDRPYRDTSLASPRLLTLTTVQ